VENQDFDWLLSVYSVAEWREGLSDRQCVVREGRSVEGDSFGFHPGICQLNQVLAHCLLHTSDKVSEGTILPRILLKIEPTPRDKAVKSHFEHQDPDKRCAFPVCYPIYQLLRFAAILAQSFDRVRCRLRVINVRLVYLFVKVKPECTIEAKNLVKAVLDLSLGLDERVAGQVADESCKTFV
jgi:hypothetical protein